MKLVQLVERATKQKVERYVGVRYSKQSVQQILDFIERNDIDNPIERKDIHTTVAYSRDPINSSVSILGDIDQPFKAKPKGFAVWKTRNEGNALVMLLTCDKLTERHLYFREQGGASYDFDEYLPHITLSYDVDPEFKVDDLKWDGDDLEVVKEYTEALDENKYSSDKE